MSDGTHADCEDTLILAFSRLLFEEHFIDRGFPLGKPSLSTADQAFAEHKHERTCAYSHRQLLTRINVHRFSIFAV